MKRYVVGFLFDGAVAPSPREVRRLLLDVAELIDYNRGMSGIGL